MPDSTHQREAISLHQLSAVSQAREVRLRGERQALTERQCALDAAWDRQAMDEALLAQQRLTWSDRWQAWARSGGSLCDAVSLRRGRELLADMALLISKQRVALQSDAERLTLDLDAWTQRWRGAQAFDDSLTTRARALRISVDRAIERQRDEDTLMTRPSTDLRAPAVALYE